MRILIWAWIVVSIVAGVTAGFLTYKKPVKQEMYGFNSVSGYRETPVPKFVSIQCKSHPCFGQRLALRSPNGGSQYEGCLVNGNMMLLRSCEISFDEAVAERSFQ